MELKRPGKANPPLLPCGDRRRVERVVTDTEIPATGCQAGIECGVPLHFTGGSEADSTVLGRAADVLVVLRDWMSIRLTRLAGKVCWAKPNHAFFHCQQPPRKNFTWMPSGAPRLDPPQALGDTPSTVVVCVHASIRAAMRRKKNT
jgi:hypothetical protein